jgi:hypothetical protein
MGLVPVRKEDWCVVEGDKHRMCVGAAGATTVVLTPFFGGQWGVQGLVADAQLACRLTDVTAGLCFRYRLAFVGLAVLALAAHVLLLMSSHCTFSRSNCYAILAGVDQMMWDNLV